MRVTLRQLAEVMHKGLELNEFYEMMHCVRWPEAMWQRRN